MLECFNIKYYIAAVQLLFAGSHLVIKGDLILLLLNGLL